MVEPANLDLATTEELVTELKKRMNFRGLIIWQPSYSGVPSTNWQYHSMHCLAADVCQEMLVAIAPPDINIDVGGGEPAVEQD